MATQVKVPDTASAPVAEAVRDVPEIASRPPTARKFTVDEYYRMAEVGILKRDERVELIEGEILVMPPIGPEHAGSVLISNSIFSERARGRFLVQIQNPIRLAEGSEPQPDAMLLRLRDDHYTGSHPTPADVLLLIEIADSSLEYDRQTKAHIYGRGGVPETWVMNLAEDCIERFTEPGPDGYARHTVHRRGETLTPVALPDLELAVADLLPGRAVEDMP